MTPLLLVMALALRLGQAPFAEAWPAPQEAAADVIAEVRIHGNQVTPDDEILRLAGIVIGAPCDDRTVGDVRARLTRSGRFRDVDVLKRFASIADPSQIVIVIVVDEGPVRIEAPDEPGAPVRVVGRRGPAHVMAWPVLSFEDGYGVTVGVRIAAVGVGGRRGRVSFPLTWGGTTQAGVEYDRPFAGGPISRLVLGSGIQRRRNPAFDANDDRRTSWIRAERSLGPVRVGGTVKWERASFQNVEDHVRSTGVDVVLDTRVDPAFPRNAVYAVATWTRLGVSSGAPIARVRTEGRGYVGLLGPSVLVLRAVGDASDRPLPPYLQPLMGGWSNLRGFKAGAFVGDTLVAGSLELRMPVSSPLRVARAGLSVFLDAGKAYTRPMRFREASLHVGAGVAAWMTVTAFRLEVAVAHGRRASTRLNFTAGFGV